MVKHVLAAGTLVASSLIVALTMSVQPAGASVVTQETTATSVLLNGGRTYHDPYDPTYPWGGGSYLHRNYDGSGYHVHPGNRWGGGGYYNNYGYFGHIH
ncbi:hypothetical protein [Streptosporangium subroseum]|uniref:hypothetical protein n=1 Tax=Streptosporangium subroseum TaxID=106412 RepID=UPI0030877102|nr:hypothetical protein OHB15_02715 [Streptosporangium subroseum]